MKDIKKHITLRAATDADKAFAHRVHHSAYHDVVVSQFGGWDESEQDDFFESTWAKYASEIILCGGEPSGYWSVERSLEEIKLHQFLILPEYQGRKIGRQLLVRLISQAIAENVPVKLQVFRESRARELYTRMGFRDTSQSGEHIAMELTPDRF